MLHCRQAVQDNGCCGSETQSNLQKYSVILRLIVPNSQVSDWRALNNSSGGSTVFLYFQKGQYTLLQELRVKPGSQTGGKFPYSPWDNTFIPKSCCCRLEWYQHNLLEKKQQTMNQAVMDDLGFLSEAVGMTSWTYPIDRQLALCWLNVLPPD